MNATDEQIGEIRRPLFLYMRVRVYALSVCRRRMMATTLQLASLIIVTPLGRHIISAGAAVNSSSLVSNAVAAVVL